MEKAIKLVSQPARWTQYALARDTEHRRVQVEDPTACSFCLAGAVQRANVDQGLPPEACQQLVQLLNKLCQARFEEKIRRYGSVDDLREFRMFPLSYVNDRLISHSGDAVQLLQLSKVFLKKVSDSPATIDQSTTKEALSTRHAPVYTAAPAARGDTMAGEKTLYIEDQSSAPPPPPPPPATPQAKLQQHVDTMLPVSGTGKAQPEELKLIPDADHASKPEQSEDSGKEKDKESDKADNSSVSATEESLEIMSLKDILGED